MKRVLALVVGLAALMASSVAVAQTEETTPPPPVSDQLQVLTPYPAVAVEPGEQVTFDLQVSAPQPTAVALSASELPEGWTATFVGEGFEVDSVTAGGGLESSVEFNVSVPAEATEGATDVVVTAAGGGETVELPLTIRVSAAAGGEVTLEPNFPGLRTPAGEAVTFDVTVNNDTPSNLQFELDAAGPAGWQVSATPSGEVQASTLSVDAGSTGTIQVEATSPAQAEAGQYTISLQARSPGTEVSTDLIVEVVGSYSMELSTTDQRLNAEVTVGSSTDLGLVVVNTGTAPLEGVAISSTPPSGWEVIFDQEAVPTVAPGETAVVTATITPSENAVAGDYVVGFSATGAEATGEIEVRTTVSPSAIWGLLGIGLIVLTLAGLAWVFRRFGRR